MRRQRYEEDPFDEDDVPLHHKRGFGAGLKRQKVEFVRATDPDHGRIKAVKTSDGRDIGDLYASIVLGGQGSGTLTSKNAAATARLAEASSGDIENPTGAEERDSGHQKQETAPHQKPQTEDAKPREAMSICAVCSLPITGSMREHEATLAHQVSLTHSHPPSALDRSRMGLRTLASQGWDPDARQGLGRVGEGLRYPIKTVAKDDTLGIGATRPGPGTAAAAAALERERPKPLNVKQLKELAEKEKRRAERLQGEIFGSVDVERYLRGDGQ